MGIDHPPSQEKPKIISRWQVIQSFNQLGDSQESIDVYTKWLDQLLEAQERREISEVDVESSVIEFMLEIGKKDEVIERCHTYINGYSVPVEDSGDTPIHELKDYAQMYILCKETLKRLGVTAA